MAQSAEPGVGWLVFALLTVVSWGLYGVLLHAGQTALADPLHGRTKAFLCVGVAYFFIAVLVPIGLLVARGASWDYPLRGLGLSLLAGVAGAVGALSVLLAFGAHGSPAVVMSIVFAGAPLVNAACTLALHPPRGGMRGLSWPFVVGTLLAALGGCLVTLYKPVPSPPSNTARQVAARPPGVGLPGGSD